MPIRMLILLYIVIASPASPLQAQTAHTDPDYATDELFWGALYAEGGHTLYCNEAFDSSPVLITVSRVYSLGWARDEMRCPTARTCLRENEDYARLASDLHNMFPVRSSFEMRRSNSRYAEVGASGSEGECGERTTYRSLEPADRVKGRIARAMLYVHATYELPLRGDLTTYQRWNREFPPDETEMERNEMIEQLQGNPNPFIDDPSLADELI